MMDIRELIVDIENNCFDRTEILEVLNTLGKSGDFYVGDKVAYQGKTYRFPGTITGITIDGQLVVSANGSPNGDFKNMKHIFGPAQLKLANR